MHGNIIGSIAGGRFNGQKEKQRAYFEFFDESCQITGESLSSLSVMETLIKKVPEGEIEAAYKNNLIKWNNKYPDVHISRSIDVSPVGWVFDSLDKTRSVARAFAQITFKDEENIMAAECFASCIYLARAKKSVTDIKEWIMTNFPSIELNKSVFDYYSLGETTTSYKNIFEKGLSAFLESKEYEGAIRNSVFIGDRPEISSSIAGALAEAMYGVPDELIEKSHKYMSDDVKLVIEVFNSFIGNNTEGGTTLFKEVVNAKGQISIKDVLDNIDRVIRYANEAVAKDKMEKGLTEKEVVNNE